MLGVNETRTMLGHQPPDSNGIRQEFISEASRDGGKTGFE
jgi:hypothetical protein